MPGGVRDDRRARGRAGRRGAPQGDRRARRDRLASAYVDFRRCSRRRCARPRVTVAHGHRQASVPVDRTPDARRVAADGAARPRHPDRASEGRRRHRRAQLDLGAPSKLNAEHDGRFLLGLGVTDGRRDVKQRYQQLAGDRAPTSNELARARPTPRRPRIGDARVLAAIGPKGLAVARERSRGRSTYRRLMTPSEHTAPIAREAPPWRPCRRCRAARADGRPRIRSRPRHARPRAASSRSTWAAELPWTICAGSTGSTDADVADGGSDRLVDLDGRLGRREGDPLTPCRRTGPDAGAEATSCIQASA